MKTFSQRKGLKTISNDIQIGEMNEELRNSLWNVLEISIWSGDDFLYTRSSVHARDDEPEILNFSKILWFLFFKKPIDTTHNDHPTAILKKIREFFFEGQWYEVYDFLEFVVQQYLHEDRQESFVELLNNTLERELSGYRFVNNVIVDITSEQEVEMLEEALQDSQFEGVSLHLKRALELLSDRKNPDYRNSIKESISAVEGMAKIVTENPKATLGDALKALEKNKELHPALKNGFSSLYGYTSDAGGVRHAMLEEPDITAADAKFFLLSCTSFVNYLKSKI